MKSGVESGVWTVRTLNRGLHWVCTPSHTTQLPLCLASFPISSSSFSYLLEQYGESSNKIEEVQQNRMKPGNEGNFCRCWKMFDLKAFP